MTTASITNSVSRLLARAAEWVDHKVGWDKLPTPLGLLALVGIRDTLRAQNLFDTETPPAPTPPDYDPTVLTRRTVEGTYNDLDRPMMGAAGRRFGRNVAPSVARPETTTLLTPNPRQVSRRLLTREQFQPAPTLSTWTPTTRGPRRPGP